MKKTFIVVLCLTILLSANYTQAQVEGANSPITTSKSSSSKTIPGMKELKKIEQRNKAAEKRERAAEKRAEKKAIAVAKKREESIAKAEKAKTSSSKTKSSRSSKRKTTTFDNASIEPANPRPSAGPVDLTGHKKIINGREVTVVEIEPRKN
ncbi:MAG: hypothetical protein HY819_05570 [Acidobacteria bacterium]|nr:hypothetical protein [Acidobacteriota bacterium]